VEPSRLAEEFERVGGGLVSIGQHEFVSAAVALRYLTAACLTDRFSEIATDLLRPKVLSLGSMSPRVEVRDFVEVRRLEGRPSPVTQVVPSQAPSGDFVGVGLLMEQDANTGEFRVNSLVQGGPADRTGAINVDDTLVRVDGVEVAGKSLEELRQLLVGPPGSVVRAHLIRARSDYESVVEMMRGLPITSNVITTPVQQPFPVQQTVATTALSPRTLESVADSDYLRDIVRNFLVIGRDTSSGTLTWLTYKLLAEPSVLDAVVDDIRAVYDQGGVAMTPGGDERVKVLSELVQGVVDANPNSADQLASNVNESVSKLQASLRMLGELYVITRPQ